MPRYYWCAPDGGASLHSAALTPRCRGTQRLLRRVPDSRLGASRGGTKRACRTAAHARAARTPQPSVRKQHNTGFKHKVRRRQLDLPGAAARPGVATLTLFVRRAISPGRAVQRAQLLPAVRSAARRNAAAGDDAPGHAPRHAPHDAPRHAAWGHAPGLHAAPAGRVAGDEAAGRATARCAADAGVVRARSLRV